MWSTLCSLLFWNLDDSHNVWTQIKEKSVNLTEDHIGKTIFIEYAGLLDALSLYYFHACVLSLRLRPSFCYNCSIEFTLDSFAMKEKDKFYRTLNITLCKKVLPNKSFYPIMNRLAVLFDHTAAAIWFIVIVTHSKHTIGLYSNLINLKIYCTWIILVWIIHKEYFTPPSLIYPN